MAKYVKIDMKRLIEKSEYDDNYQLVIPLHLIADLPPVDVAPVVHGKWLEKKEWHLGRWVTWFECSRCGAHDDNFEMYPMMPFCDFSNYCPECGTKMDEE